MLAPRRTARRSQWRVALLSAGRFVASLLDRREVGAAADRWALAHGESFHNFAAAAVASEVVLAGCVLFGAAWAVRARCARTPAPKAKAA